MTAVAPTAGREGPGPTPTGSVPWRRLTWVAWRQHRAALLVFVILAGLIAIAYKLNETLVCRDLAFCHDEPRLIAPDLKIRVGRLAGDGHPRPRLISLRGLCFIT